MPGADSAQVRAEQDYLLLSQVAKRAVVIQSILLPQRQSLDITPRVVVRP